MREIRLAQGGPQHTQFIQFTHWAEVLLGRFRDKEAETWRERSMTCFMLASRHLCQGPADQLTADWPYMPA